MSGNSAARPLRVAIVGLGPKGLYALERLISRARELSSGSIAITAYEPHPAPGAGPVYDPTQPIYLRMNFAAELVNMWPDGEGPSFTDWRAGIPELADDAYPPRAEVGRYLSDGFKGLRASLPSSIRLAVRQESVRTVKPSAGGWSVVGQDELEHDEVLVATGHEENWDGGLTALPPSSEGPSTRVFPVERELSADRVPPGSIVAIRGFALTMIDAALALTEGRGGRFSKGRQSHLLRYHACRDEVGAILPWSRTGRPMLAKPDPAQAIRSPEIDRIAAQGRAELSELSAGSALSGALSIIATASARSLGSITDAAPSASGVLELLERASGGEPLPADLSQAGEIERSLGIAARVREPGIDWALGHTWRALYPALVERLGADGLEPGEWPSFLLLAKEMERIAFGPPPINAAKLLGLIECGKVDLASATEGPARRADVVVDAVLPPPGAALALLPLIEELVRDGLVRIPENRRGIELTSDVECVGADGSPSRGLGAIGRPTEDWIIGNDTLNRNLHPQPDLWAQRVVSRAAG